jgi:S-adenosylmethionine decarboxylase proenzyme
MPHDSVTPRLPSELQAAVPPAAAVPSPYLGHQIMAEFHNCPAGLLAEPEAIERVMRAAAEACGATIVNSVFHHFNPHGVSGAVIIAESHLAIHTWPEYGYAAVDVFTCGTTIQPAEAIAYLAVHLQAQHHTFSEVRRGNVKLLEAMRQVP